MIRLLPAVFLLLHFSGCAGSNAPAIRLTDDAYLFADINGNDYRKCAKYNDLVTQHTCLMGVAIWLGDRDRIIKLANTPYVNKNYADPNTRQGHWLGKAADIIQPYPERALRSVEALFEAGIDPNALVYEQREDPVSYPVMSYPVIRDFLWTFGPVDQQVRIDAIELFFSNGQDFRAIWSINSQPHWNLVTLGVSNCMRPPRFTYPVGSHLAYKALEAGADPNWQNSNGVNALMHIAFFGGDDPEACERNIRMLVEAGASLDARSNDGYTVTDYAALFVVGSGLCSSTPTKEPWNFRKRPGKDRALAVLLSLGAPEPTVSGSSLRCRVP